MVTANTKTYILPPLPQRQVPTVIEVSPQPQDMKNFSKFIPKGVKDSLKKICL